MSHLVPYTYLCIVVRGLLLMLGGLLLHRSELFGGDAQSTQAILGYAATLPGGRDEGPEANPSNCRASRMLLDPSSVVEALNVYRYLPKP